MLWQNINPHKKGHLPVDAGVVSAAGLGSSGLSSCVAAGFDSASSAFFSGSLDSSFGAAAAGALAAGGAAGAEEAAGSEAAAGLGVAGLAFGLLTITTTKLLSLIL